MSISLNGLKDNLPRAGAIPRKGGLSTTVSESSHEPFERPVDRYGAARRPLDTRGNRWTGRAVIIAVLAVAIITVALFAQFISHRNESDVSGTATNFERIDDHTMSMRVDISRDDPSQPAYCIVSAIDYDKAEVGRRDVIVPAGGDHTQRLEVDIPTRDVPVSVSVYGCSTRMPWFLEY